MTPFDFLALAISVILGLVITRLISGIGIISLYCIWYFFNLNISLTYSILFKKNNLIQVVFYAMYKLNIHIDEQEHFS